ncbi:MAG: four helix bundle protein [Luteibaculum sp.]
MNKPNIVLERSIDFSLGLITYCEELESLKKFVVANQLLKSGTSIGANLHEAQNAESRQDFLHKVKIAGKELEETRYWLILCERAESYPFKEELKARAEELGLIIFKIISSTSKNLNQLKEPEVDYGNEEDFINPLKKLVK